MIELLGLGFLAFSITFILIPPLARALTKLDMVVPDVHKPSKPLVPELGGLAILASLVTVTLLASIAFPDLSKELLAFVLVLLIAALVGIIDDLYGLHPAIKPLLMMVACLPLLLLQTYSNRPTLPILGKTRLTIIYPAVLLPLSITVPANAVNMMDVLNGTMAGTCSLVALTMLISSIVLGRPAASILSASLLGSLLAFYFYNRYPARIMAGDVGSLLVGAAIGAIAVLGRIEFLAVIALLPHIANAFYILSGGKKSLRRREAMARPVRLVGDKLFASEDPDAPLTLTRLIVAHRPLSEPEVLRVQLILSGVSCLLTLLTLPLIHVHA